MSPIIQAAEKHQAACRAYSQDAKSLGQAIAGASDEIWRALFGEQPKLLAAGPAAPEPRKEDARA